MLLTFNYFLIDVKQISYLSTVFAAETEVMGTMATFSKHKSLSAVKKDKSK
jgi:hypothetical protein